MNSAQAAQPGSANQAHQHSLGLVVERVAGDDFVELGMTRFVSRCVGSQKLLKKSVPQLTSCRLYSGMLLGSPLSHIATGYMKFQTVLMRQCGDEFLICVRLRSAQLVVEVNNGEDEADLVTHFEQQAEKRN
jgi:hypothetical protein